MSNKNNNGSGISFLSLLTVLFVGLKLTDNIDWSWWWVLAPLWMPIIAVLGLVLVIFAYKASK
jgi:hypothetical protein